MILKFKIQNSNKAFTAIELIVVVAIIAVLSAVVIANFPHFRLELSLSRTAYKFAQEVRKAQAMSLSSMRYKDSEGQVQSIGGYGVYASTEDNKKYILYADAVPTNQQYDPETDYIVETVDFSQDEPGVNIKEFVNIESTDVSINFVPPNSATIITPAPDQNRLDIVFSIESDTERTKTVSVNTAGLIEVK